MAYFDLSNNQSEKNRLKKTKIWGVVLVVFCSFVFLTLLTNFFPFCKSFILGFLGLFAYPLSIVAFCVGVAFLNNKKYVMPKKYIVYISCAVLSCLALLNIVILGNPNNTFFEYLGLTYNYQFTAGGLITGIVLAPILKILGLAGAIIIFSIIFVVFVALIIDFIHSIKVYGFKKESKSNIKENKQVITPKSPKKQEKINIFLDKKLNDQQNQTALIKLGLIEGNIDSAKAPAEKKSLREQLLTPPEIDLNFFANRNINSKANTKTEKPNNSFSYESKQPDTPKPNVNNNQKFNTFFEKPKPEEQQTVNQNGYRPKKFADLSSQNETNYNSYKDEVVEEDDGYIKPPLSLLENHEINLETLNEDVVGKRIQLENTLETFGINAKVKGVVVGPSVTRYEIEMPQGVSVKKILALEDDISLTMAARSGIRIEAPIPGKSAVGIEVPNDNIATVSLREVLETEEFKNARSPVAFALGKNISGSPEVCNLAKMPHILVAGATNSGKSICLNSIILSIIYRSSPKDVRLILIDPKRVEFTLYNELPHLLIPNVINEVDKAVNALLWCINEMERRFELLQMSRCRNLEEYNKTPDVKNGDAPKMAYIVVVVDELADLMSSGKKEIEEYLRRLTQKSRAAGILLVLATQRPSVDVITGVIKTNCPARISFALTSNTDSRTILDCGGAENLLGRGDMLYKPTDAGSPRRVQGCFVSGEEVEKIINYVKENNTQDFDEKTKEVIEKENINSYGQYEGNIGDTNWDPLLPNALKMFIENGQASTSAIQRRFLAGFPRASRIVDQLCQMGYLSAPEGNKPRKILITMEEFYEKFGQVD